MANEASSDSERTSKKDVPIEVGTHFLQQRYLYAFATQSEVTHYIRTQAISEESARLNEFLRRWSELQPRVQQLIQTEAGIADTIALSELPSGHHEQVGRYTADKLFTRTFSGLQSSSVCLRLTS